jgi:hypothetical protein
VLSPRPLLPILPSPSAIVTSTGLFIVLEHFLPKLATMVFRGTEEATASTMRESEMDNISCQETENATAPPINMKDQKQVLIPIASGSCEMETITIATTLQKFGAIVVLASVDEPTRNCCMQGGFMILADMTINDALNYDWDLIVIPGFAGKLRRQC